VIHELTHVVQDYTSFSCRTGGWRVLLEPLRPFRIWHSQEYRMGWLSDGIADYVTYKYFVKNLQPELRMDANGYLTGYTNSEPHLFAPARA
jgi:hypothetical protein